MGIIAGDLVTRARVMLHDAGANQRFTDTEYLSALALAVAATGYLRPGWATTATFLVHTGGTAATAVRLDEALPGTFTPLCFATSFLVSAPRYAILRTTRAALDRSDPLWASTYSSDGAELRRYAIDDDGDILYITPAMGLAWYTFGTVTYRNAALSSVTSIDAPAAFSLPLIYYACYFLLNADTADASERQLATTYYRLFVASLSGTWPADEDE